MTRQSIIERAARLERPEIELIGRFPVGEGFVEFPLGRPELARDTAWTQRVLESYGLAPGAHLVNISAGWQSPWIVPLLDACRSLHVIYSNVEAMTWDAKRAEMFIRRLNPEMVIGMDGAFLTSLANIVEPAERLGPVPHLLLRPDAREVARDLGLDGFRLFSPLGPAIGIECRHGTGLHVDPDEWTVDAVDGELRISTTGDRLARLRDQELGLGGHLDETHCSCGLPGARVHLDE
jgi:hypothetical protein